MNFARARQRRLVLMVVAAGVLAVSVLAWGTEYKVSLYPAQHRESREPVPFAKLLSERERPLASHGFDAYTAIRTAAALTVLLFASAVRQPRCSRDAWILGLVPRPNSLRLPCLSHLWFRPPPVPAL